MNDTDPQRTGLAAEPDAGPSRHRSAIGHEIGHEPEVEAVPLVAGDAFIALDLQRDFLPGGVLAVPGAHQVIEPVNACMAAFARLDLPVHASRDGHPPQHCSFREQGGPWPAHGIAGAAGAEFADGLRLPHSTVVISKGGDARVDACSAFDRTGLATRLRACGVKRLFVAGVATDRCVLQTVRAAIAEGFEVVVVSDAIAATGITPGDGQRAVVRMRTLGAIFVTSHGIAPRRPVRV
ncbi:nicotinamidase/pyrazinamidase [Sphaerotilus hippei]|uniref:nicotinamidase n=1 Tax=Sphaerotilus hippei TaxID=744406 RepID=A0A318H1H8_9BURK|nr:isochorismatase family protein [Sphaerotilus hippei]PXW95235.1 nicotinamidase/pyrazinamidase [Sphaerotilus hippei]